MNYIIHSALTLLCLLPFHAIAQNDGDYRSAATGDWNVAGTWERYNGGSMNWEPAVTAPASTDGVDAESSCFVSEK